MKTVGKYATLEMDSCCQSNTVLHTYADAIQLLANHCQSIYQAPPTETINLSGACNRVLAEAIHLDRDEPPIPRSAMDGFAILLSDPGPKRTILEVKFAGDIAGHELQPQTAVQVMTGAPVPPNAEAVVLIEHCEIKGDTLKISKLPTKSNIRAVAETAAAGEVAVSANSLLGPAEISAIAGCGRNKIKAYVKPRVTIISTGDELVDYSNALGDHQTRDSNRPMLHELLEKFGASVVESKHAADDTKQLNELVAQAIDDSDLVITVGGVSMGEKDHLPNVFSKLGVEKLLHKVAMRPGKPIWLGSRDSTMVVGLPGNPVSAFVGASLFVRPIVDSMMGDFSRRITPRVAIAAHEFKSKARHDFVVAKYDQDGRVSSTKSSGSADWRCVAGTEVLVSVPSNSVISSGEQAAVIPV